MMLIYILYRILILLIFSQSTDGASDENMWLYPPESQPNKHFGDSDTVWLLGSTVNLRYVSKI